MYLYLYMYKLIWNPKNTDEFFSLHFVRFWWVGPLLSKDMVSLELRYQQ